MKVVDEVVGVPYWVRESKVDLEFIHKEVPSREPGGHIAKVFLL